MRRLMAVVGVAALGSAALTGCGKARDLFASRSDVAAEAGSSALSTTRLAGILNGGKTIRPTKEAAEFVTSVWVDYSLFAQAVAQGKLPIDSATVAAAMWPDIAELRGSHWHDTLLARRGHFTAKSADSAYAGDELRVFQHILFRIAPDASPDQKAAIRKQAETTLGQAKAGDFGALAKRLSQDPGSAADSGFLPPSRKGQWVTAFDSAGWSLQPGAVSGLVETPFGVHIIRRPPVEAVRGRLLAFLQQSAGGKLDSLYLDSLATQKQLKVKDDAPALMKAAVQDMEGNKDSKKEIASFKGGGLSVAEFLRWVRALPPQYTQQIKQAPDDQLKQFARIISQNVLLMRQADSAKVGLTPAEWQAMSSAFRAQIDTLRTEMGLGGDVVDSSVAPAQRLKVAEVKVDQYFDQLLAGKTRLRALPATLGAVLRERGQYRIHPKGIDQAVEVATKQKARTDSLKLDSLGKAGAAPTVQPGMVPGAPQGPAAQGAIKPAPGGAPR